jgi:hypothetical protein
MTLSSAEAIGDATALFTQPTKTHMENERKQEELSHTDWLK